MFDDALQPLLPASVRRFDVATGEIDTVVVPGGEVVAGLALAEDGRIWFGSGVAVGDLVFDIATTTDDGEVQTLGTAFDTTGGLYSLTDQGLDLAVTPHAAVAFLANICPADTNASSVVDVADLITLLADWGPCDTGCASDLEDRAT